MLPKPAAVITLLLCSDKVQKVGARIEPVWNLGNPLAGSPINFWSDCNNAEFCASRNTLAVLIQQYNF